jgi:hypothetical protein
VLKSKQHSLWLLEHGKEICNEFYKRYRKVGEKQHASLDILLYLEKNGAFPNDNGWENPPQVLPEDVICNDTVEAYRKYYNVYKREFATWKAPATVPNWFQLNA